MNALQKLQQEGRDSYEKVLREVGAWSDCNGRKCSKCWADRNFSDDLIALAYQAGKDAAVGYIETNAPRQISDKTLNKARLPD